MQFSFIALGLDCGSRGRGVRIPLSTLHLERSPQVKLGGFFRGEDDTECCRSIQTGRNRAVCVQPLDLVEANVLGKPYDPQRVAQDAATDATH